MIGAECFDFLTDMVSNANLDYLLISKILGKNYSSLMEQLEKQNGVHHILIQAYIRFCGSSRF